MKEVVGLYYVVLVYVGDMVDLVFGCFVMLYGVFEGLVAYMFSILVGNHGW